MQTVIGLLRHGQTDWNVDMRLQGVSDIPLNETGRQQARVAGSVLAAHPWTRIVSSPLTRAIETAEIVRQSVPINDFEIHDLLLERSFGEAEGQTYEEWRERFQSGVNAKGAESIEDLEIRSNILLATFAEIYSGDHVLAVSHGALIRKIINVVSRGELPREGEKFSNASLTTIGFDGTVWSILNYDPKSLGH